MMTEGVKIPTIRDLDNSPEDREPMRELLKRVGDAIGSPVPERKTSEADFAPKVSLPTQYKEASGVAADMYRKFIDYGENLAQYYEEAGRLVLDRAEQFNSECRAKAKQTRLEVKEQAERSLRLTIRFDRMGKAIEDSSKAEV